MKLKWTLEDSGLGWKYHKSGDYMCEPYDLDFGHWGCSHGGKYLGEGTWQECRAICQKHHDEGKKTNA